MGTCLCAATVTEAILCFVPPLSPPPPPQPRCHYCDCIGLCPSSRVSSPTWHWLGMSLPPEYKTKATKTRRFEVKLDR